MYGGSKNYALCSKESYIVHVVLVDGSVILHDQKEKVLGKNILKSIKTKAIHMGELPQNYAMWLTPLLFIALIIILLAYVAYRKK